VTFASFMHCCKTCSHLPDEWLVLIYDRERLLIRMIRGTEWQVTDLIIITIDQLFWICRYYVVLYDSPHHWLLQCEGVTSVGMSRSTRGHRPDDVTRSAQESSRGSKEREKETVVGVSPSSFSRRLGRWRRRRTSLWVLGLLLTQMFVVVLRIVSHRSITIDI
jgi:hypothetical protein